MTELSSEAMESEFDTVAGWTEEAVRRARTRATPFPPGCRGSGSEGALRWLADGWSSPPGTRMLDAGSGVGGPAGWLAADAGLRPSAPSRCGRPCGPPAAVRAARGGALAAAAVRRRRVRRRLVPGRAVHDPGQGRRSGRAAPGARRRRPARAAGVRGRRSAAAAAARGQRVPVGGRAARAARRGRLPARRVRPTPTSRRQPRGMDRASRRGRRRGGAGGTGTTRRSAAQEQSGGWAGCRGGCGPGWVSPRLGEHGCKETLAKLSLHS